MNENSPPHLETARDQLEQALSRLEEAAAKLGQERDAASQARAAELAAIKAEHESLDRALKQAEADHAALRRVTETVSTRLDATIGNLKSILGG